MWLVAGAVVLGLLGGLAMGGSLRRLGDVRFRWWGLAFVGLALQLVPVSSRPGQLDHWLGIGLLIGSYLVLLVFVTANIRLAGFPVIAAGFVLNVLVISLNGGMPVSDHALRAAAGPYYRQTLERLTTQGGAKHHLRRPDDDVVGLSDIVPVGAPVRQVLSVGDVLWLAGTAWVIARAMAGRPVASDAIHGSAGTEPDPAHEDK